MNINDDNLKEEVLKIYTPLSIAKREIRKRWADEKLRKKVADFLGGDIPDFFKDKPIACSVRSIISPDFEFLFFLRIMKEFKMEFACLEYAGDKFTSSNEDKYHFGRMFFDNGKGKKGGNKIVTRKIIDFNSCEGKSVNKLKTVWGENFVEFHHRMLNKIAPESVSNVYDFSSWLKRRGKDAKSFYVYYLALFICHGILFENFFAKGNEESFTRKIVIANVKKLENMFGVKPLIVPLTPIDDEEDLYWYCYPGNLLKEIKIR
jgi:hypothetical protein